MSVFSALQQVQAICKAALVAWGACARCAAAAAAALKAWVHVLCASLQTNSIV
jgi:hypothetical protein